MVILVVLGLAVSVVVGLFDGVIRELPIIVSFQSLILGMAGNVGTQSLAVTVRTLGSQELDTKKQFGLIFKETRVALFNGIFRGISLRGFDGRRKKDRAGQKTSRTGVRRGVLHGGT